MDIKNLKQVGWITESGDMKSMSYKAIDPRSKWKPLYVDQGYTGIDHLTDAALRVKIHNSAATTKGKAK